MREKKAMGERGLSSYGGYLGLPRQGEASIKKNSANEYWGGVRWAAQTSILA